MSQELGKKIVEMRQSGAKYEEIQKEIKCAWSTISYHCKKAGMSSGTKFKKPSKEEVANWQTLYDSGLSVLSVSKKVGWCPSSIRQNIETRHQIKRTVEEKQKLNVERVAKRRKKLKQLLVEYKGGKCEVCGYSKCIRALEFHHTNPLEKQYQISNVTNSFEILKKEVDKCMLVCANCHREIEDKIVGLT